MHAKMRGRGEMKELAEQLRTQGKTLVTSNGSFDILHCAHIHLLQKARQLGDVLIVLVNSDESIRKNKGEKRPIIPEEERAHMLASLACVDYIVIFGDEKPLSLLEELKPHAHVKGGSGSQELMGEEAQLIARWGGQFKQFGLEEGFSTTNIIEKILSAYNSESSE